MVGDLAETIARVLPKAEKTDERELSQWMEELLDLRSAEEDEKKAFVLDAWACLNGTGALGLQQVADRRIPPRGEPEPHGACTGCFHSARTQ